MNPLVLLQFFCIGTRKQGNQKIAKQKKRKHLFVFLTIINYLFYVQSASTCLQLISRLFRLKICNYVITLFYSLSIEIIHRNVNHRRSVLLDLLYVQDMISKATQNSR